MIWRLQYLLEKGASSTSRLMTMMIYGLVLVEWLTIIQAFEKL